MLRAEATSSHVKEILNLTPSILTHLLFVCCVCVYVCMYVCVCVHLWVCSIYECEGSLTQRAHVEVRS